MPLFSVCSTILHITQSITLLDAQFLLKYLRGCKYSMEKTKKKLDMTLTLRTALPEFFSDWDPMSPENQEALSMG